LLIEVSATTFPMLRLPEWTATFVTVMLMIGFPVALIFAWAFELTPEGIKKEKEVDRSQSTTHVTGRKLDYLIIAVLVVALGYFAFDKFMLDPSRHTELVQATTEAATEQAATNSTASAESDKSIAVLPFVNMSDDAANEYFSDGISEELLNLLAKIPEFRVISRSSAFSYKGKDFKIADVGRELNVAYVLEGSVRKAGNKVRITAQLIEVDSDTHQWSDTYDRTLDDIFAIQDEIASKVADALQVALLGESRSEREIDPEIYALWLKGLYFLNQRGQENYKKSEKVLLQAIELEPGYANAWQLLAFTYYQQTIQGFRTSEEGHALAMGAIDRAMSLDPDQGVIQGAYGFLKKNLDWDWDTAHTALTKAYQLNPNRNAIRIWRASLIQTLGRPDEAIKIYTKALAADPLNTSIYSSLGILYRKVGRFDDAIVMFEKQIELRPDYHWAYFNLGKSYLLKGDAAQALVEIEKNPSNVYRHLGLVLAYSTLGREAEARAALEYLVSEYGEQRPTWIAEGYSWRGEKDQAFEWLEKAYVQKDIGLAYLLNSRVFETLSDDPRWVELLRKLELLEYWQAMPAAYGGPAKPAG
jgi:adenylate cyclase